MKEEAVNDALLRQFILGKANDEVRERMEGLFLTDAVMRERVLAAEQDLIEDYLEGSLSGEDEERFLLRYAQTPEQQRKLRIAKSIKDWAIAEAGGDAVYAVNAAGVNAEAGVERAVQETRLDAAGADASPRTESVSAWERLRETLRARPTLAIPIAAVAILAIVFAISWVNRWREQRRHFAIEQELARLNTPSSLRETPPGSNAVVLNPLTLRSGESSPEVSLRADMTYVEFHLLWRREQYPSYRPVLRPLRESDSFVIPDVQPADADGHTIRLKIPAHVLTRGTYQIQITGIDPDGSTGPTEQYRLTVGG